MLIHSAYKKVSDNLSIKINDVLLDNVETCKYIGVTVDTNLNWYQHINNICGKVSPMLYKLRRISKSCPPEIVKTIYQTCIQPHIEYLCTAWGNTSCKNMQQVQRLQNLGARIVTNNFDYINVRGIDLVKKLGWQTVEERYKYLLSTLMFKSIHGLAPNYLCDNVTMLCDIVPYNTRFAYNNNVHKPKPNTNKFKQSFVYKGADAWNQLPESVKDCTKLNTFKYNYKKVIFSSQT